MRRSLNRRKVKTIEELDITSLLDVLVILLVFLLKSYSSSSFELETPTDLMAPLSVSTKEGVKNPTVKITKDGDVYLEKELLSNINEPPAFSILEEKLGEVDAKNKNTLNVLIDQHITFKNIDRSVKTASKAGFQKISLIVQYKE